MWSLKKYQTFKRNQNYSQNQINQNEFLGSSQYIVVRKNDLLINPYLFLYLHEQCLKILTCFKKETLELKPDSSCRIDWEYVDGIHEKDDKYSVPLPKTKYWLSKQNEYDIFSFSEDESEEFEENQGLQKELKQIWEENHNSQSIKIEEEEQEEQSDFKD